MKRRMTITALVVVIAVAMVTGCAGEPGYAIGFPEDDAYAPPYEDDAYALPREEVLVATPFYFEFGGYEINLFQDMADLLGALGEPLDVFEVPSCAFEGYDRVFIYPGVDIFTFPIDGIDMIHIISLQDDTVYTPEGINIGADFQRVLDALGDDYSHDADMFTFTRGLTTLQFRVADDGRVLAIIYGVILDDG